MVMWMVMVMDAHLPFGQSFASAFEHSQGIFLNGHARLSDLLVVGSGQGYVYGDSARGQGYVRGVYCVPYMYLSLS